MTDSNPNNLKSSCRICVCGYMAHATSICTKCGRMPDGTSPLPTPFDSRVYGVSLAYAKECTREGETPEQAKERIDNDLSNYFDYMKTKPKSHNLPFGDKFEALEKVHSLNEALRQEEFMEKPPATKIHVEQYNPKYDVLRKMIEEEKYKLRKMIRDEEER